MIPKTFKLVLSSHESPSGALRRLQSNKDSCSISYVWDAETKCMVQKSIDNIVPIFESSISIQVDPPRDKTSSLDSPVPSYLCPSFSLNLLSAQAKGVMDMTFISITKMPGVRVNIKYRSDNDPGQFNFTGVERPVAPRCPYSIESGDMICVQLIDAEEKMTFIVEGPREPTSVPVHSSDDKFRLCKRADTHSGPSATAVFWVIPLQLEDPLLRQQGRLFMGKAFPKDRQFEPELRLSWPAHRNTVKRVAIQQSHRHSTAIFESTSGPNAQDFIRWMIHNQLDIQPFFMQYLKNVGSAASSLHQVGVVHLGLIPQNVVVTFQNENLGFKVVDFGLADLVDPHRGATNRTGLSSTAPIEFVHSFFDCAADIYIIAATLLESAGVEFPAIQKWGDLLVAGRSIHTLLPPLLKDAKYAYLHPIVSHPHLLDLLLRMTEMDHYNRIRGEEIEYHPLFGPKQFSVSLSSHLDPSKETLIDKQFHSIRDASQTCRVRVSNSPVAEDGNVALFRAMTQTGESRLVIRCVSSSPITAPTLLKVLRARSNSDFEWVSLEADSTVVHLLLPSHFVRFTDLRQTGFPPQPSVRALAAMVGIVIRSVKNENMLCEKRAAMIKEGSKYRTVVEMTTAAFSTLQFYVDSRDGKTMAFVPLFVYDFGKKTFDELVELDQRFTHPKADVETAVTSVTLETCHRVLASLCGVTGGLKAALQNWIHYPTDRAVQDILEVFLNRGEEIATLGEYDDSPLLRLLGAKFSPYRLNAGTQDDMRQLVQQFNQGNNVPTFEIEFLKKKGLIAQRKCVPVVAGSASSSGISTQLARATKIDDRKTDAPAEKFNPATHNVSARYHAQIEHFSPHIVLVRLEGARGLFSDVLLHEDVCTFELASPCNDGSFASSIVSIRWKAYPYDISARYEPGVGVYVSAFEFDGSPIGHAEYYASDSAPLSNDNLKKHAGEADDAAGDKVYEQKHRAFAMLLSLLEGATWAKLSSADQEEIKGHFHQALIDESFKEMAKFLQMTKILAKIPDYKDMIPHLTQSTQMQAKILNSIFAAVEVQQILSNDSSSSN